MNKLNDTNIDSVASIGSLRDYLEFLRRHKQFITWPEAVMPEPDIRNVIAAGGRDFMTQPAILFDKITGFQAKNQDDKKAMINFSLNMIEELSEGDSMINVHTRLIRQYI